MPVGVCLDQMRDRERDVGEVGPRVVTATPTALAGGEGTEARQRDNDGNPDADRFGVGLGVPGDPLSRHRGHGQVGVGEFDAVDAGLAWHGIRGVGRGDEDAQPGAGLDGPGRRWEDDLDDRRRAWAGRDGDRSHEFAWKRGGFAGDLPKREEESHRRARRRDA